MTAGQTELPRGEIAARWPTLLAAVTGLTFSVGTVLFFTFGIFVKPLESEYGWNRAQLSGAVLALQLSLAAASLLYGFLIDRYGARRIILISIVLLSALVASLYVLDNSLWQFYLVYALVPLAAGAASPIGYARMIVARFDRARGLALGLALAGVGIGAAVLPPLAQMLITDYGWRAAYLGLGAATFAVTFPTCFLLLPRHETERAVDPAAGDTGQAWALMRTPLYLKLAVLFLIIGAVTAAAVAHMVPIMKIRGLSDNASAGVAAIAGIAVISGRGFIGYALDRLQAAYVLVVILALLATALAVLTFTAQPGFLLAVAFLIGFTVGAEVDVMAYMVSRYFPERFFSKLYSTAFGLFMASSGVGPLLLGISFAKTGGYRQGLIFMIAAALVAIALGSRLPRYKQGTSFDPQQGACADLPR
jgi:MFS family permease